MNAEEYFNLAQEKFNSQQYAESIEYYGKAIELGSEQTPIAYFMRGMMYARVEKYDKAIDDFTAAIELIGNNEIYSLRADSYAELKQYGKALDDYNKYLELVSASDNLYGVCSAYYRMGYIKYIQGDSEQALSYYKRTRELDPNFENIDNEIEMCEEALK